MRISKVSLAALFFLAACGGGGGGDGGGTVPGGVTNTPLAIDASNYVAVATESVSAVSYVLDTTEFFNGAQVSSERVLLDFARAQALKLPRWFAAATPRPSGAVLTETVLCDGGGSMQVTLNDINGNEDVDPGESITMVATNCVEFDSTVNGTIVMQITALSGDLEGDVYDLGVTMTLTNLSVAMAEGTTVGNGSMAMGMAMTGPHTGSLDLTFNDLTMTGTFGGNAYSRTMWNFNIAESYALVNNMFHGETVLSGTLGSSALASKAVVLSTLQPMVSVGEDEYPSSGQILATGASGSKMRLTAQNATTVLIELDANGDDTYETMVTRPWSDLM
jgi:hypothetical protein